MPDFDALYHQFFLRPIMVEHLVRAFVGAAMAAGIDFSRMELVPAKFYTGKKGKGRQRRGDIIWRLPTHASGEIYLYLMFEFQSTVHWWMSVRAQVYQGLLFQQIVAEKRLERDSKLPPVLTLVLYNGAEAWTAPTGVSELIGLPEDSPLWPRQFGRAGPQRATPPLPPLPPRRSPRHPRWPYRRRPPAPRDRSSCGSGTTRLRPA